MPRQVGGWGLPVGSGPSVSLPIGCLGGAGLFPVLVPGAGSSWTGSLECRFVPSWVLPLGLEFLATLTWIWVSFLARFLVLFRPIFFFFSFLPIHSFITIWPIRWWLNDDIWMWPLANDIGLSCLSDSNQWKWWHQINENENEVMINISIDREN